MKINIKANSQIVRSLFSTYTLHGVLLSQSCQLNSYTMINRIIWALFVTFNYIRIVYARISAAYFFYYDEPIFPSPLRCLPCDINFAQARLIAPQKRASSFQNSIPRREAFIKLQNAMPRSRPLA